MSDFYLNDSECCLADEYFCSSIEKISDFENDNIEFNQCFLDDEVRSKELTKALRQVESSEEFAFYNLGLSEKEQEILSNIEINDSNNLIINSSYFQLGKLKKEIQKVLLDMRGVNIVESNKVSYLMTRIISIIVGELKSEEFELKIRSIESYQSKENCMYWHLDKSQEEELRDPEITKEKRFIIVLKGQGTLYKKISDKQREDFIKLAEEGPSFYGHGIKACKADDGINQLFNQQETYITKSQYGSVHIVGYKGTIHTEPKESESRLILLLTPKIKVI